MEDNMTKSCALLPYNNGTDREYISVILGKEPFWRNQNGRIELFDCPPEHSIGRPQNISKVVRRID